MCTITEAAEAARKYTHLIVVAPPHWGRGASLREALEQMRINTGHKPRTGDTVHVRRCSPEAFIDGMGYLYHADPDDTLRSGKLAGRGDTLRVEG